MKDGLHQHRCQRWYHIASIQLMPTGQCHFSVSKFTRKWFHCKYLITAHPRFTKPSSATNTIARLHNRMVQLDGSTFPPAPYVVLTFPALENLSTRSHRHGLSHHSRSQWIWMENSLQTTTFGSILSFIYFFVLSALLLPKKLTIGEQHFHSQTKHTTLQSMYSARCSDHQSENNTTC